MTEQHAPSGAEEPAPPKKAAADEHAGAVRSQNGAQAARAPLGEWRGPAFWMACGALLAGLAGAVVVLVERAAVERDMMAVAATLPQQAAPSAMSAGTAAGASQAPAAGQAGGAPPAASQRSALASRPGSALDARHAAASDEKPAAAAGARRHAAKRPAVALAPRIAGAPRATALKTRTKTAPASRRKHAIAADKYAEVFKRCPPPGMPGSVQCRRDICNGAEGKGPACRPYLSKLR